MNSDAFRKYGSRLLAAILPCLILVIIWSVGIAPVLDTFDQLRGRRDGLIAVIAKEKAEVSDAPALRAALLTLQSRQAQLVGLREEPSEVLAQAGLQNDLQKIVGGLGGQTISVEPLPSTIEGGYQAVSLQATILFPNSSLGDLLRSIEERQPYIFITAASFQSADAQSDGSDAGSVGNLTLICTITAYRHP